jgi:CHAD domain-containing protein
MTSAVSSPSDALLMRFQPSDTATKISRATLAKLAKQLGYQRESEVLHYAALKLASEVLPTYEPDDEPLTAKQMAAIRKAAGPAGRGKVISSLF